MKNEQPLTPTPSQPEGRKAAVWVCTCGCITAEWISKCAHCDKPIETMNKRWYGEPGLCAQSKLDKAVAALREIYNKGAVINCTNYTRQQVVNGHIEFRATIRGLADAALKEIEGE